MASKDPTYLAIPGKKAARYPGGVQTETWDLANAMTRCKALSYCRAITCNLVST